LAACTIRSVTVWSGPLGLFATMGLPAINGAPGLPGPGGRLSARGRFILRETFSVEFRFGKKWPGGADILANPPFQFVLSELGGGSFALQAQTPFPQPLFRGTEVFKSPPARPSRRQTGHLRLAQRSAQLLTLRCLASPNAKNSSNVAYEKAGYSASRGPVQHANVQTRRFLAFTPSAWRQQKYPAARLKIFLPAARKFAALLMFSAGWSQIFFFRQPILAPGRREFWKTSGKTNQLPQSPPDCSARGSKVEKYSGLRATSILAGRIKTWRHFSPKRSRIHSARKTSTFRLDNPAQPPPRAELQTAYRETGVLVTVFPSAACPPARRNSTQMPR